MKKLILIIIVFSTLQVFSQTQIGTGNSRMQITYRFSSFANYRAGWDSAYLDRKQNKFFLRNAQILLKGTFGKNTEFDFGLDGAQLISKANDPQNPALVDANLTYKGLGFVDLILGYGKVPYSRNNFVSFFESPFWQRPEIVGGAGEYFEPVEIDSIRHAIENVLYSDIRRQELTKAGYKRAASFSWEKCASETLGIYRTII
jgi:hypothetical protein